MPTPRLLVAALSALPALSCITAPDTDPGHRTALSAKLRTLATAAPLVVAHRGASDEYPENTLPALRAAVDAGAPMVELDFRQTADGTLVVLHDKTLDRTTDCRSVWKRQEIAVDSVTLSDLRQLDAGAWKHERFAGTRVPTLEQALEVIQAGSVTMIEHKAGDPERLVALLRRMKLIDDVLVQSFDWPWLERLHRLEPRLTIAALGGESLDREALDTLPRLGTSMVHWRGEDLTADDVAALHRRGYLACAYTLNSDLELLGAAALGLDLVTTDRPARLLSLIAERRVLRPER